MIATMTTACAVRHAQYGKRHTENSNGPEIRCTKKFFSDWGIHHRLCSVANPHSNSRAEIGVKTVKRALADNTPANGNLDCDKFQ